MSLSSSRHVTDIVSLSPSLRWMHLGSTDVTVRQHTPYTSHIAGTIVRSSVPVHDMVGSSTGPCCLFCIHHASLLQNDWCYTVRGHCLVCSFRLLRAARPRAYSIGLQSQAFIRIGSAICTVTMQCFVSLRQSNMNEFDIEWDAGRNGEVRIGVLTFRIRHLSVM